MRKLLSILSATGLGLLVLSLGCSSSSERVLPDQDLELHAVTGTVRVDGEAAAGVSLGFQPADGTKGSGGFATTDAEGKFTVVSASGRDGLPAGTYHILLTWLTTKDGKPIPKDAMMADYDFVNQLPERFNTHEGTPYFVGVEAGENPPLELDVKRNAK